MIKYEHDSGTEIMKKSLIYLVDDMESIAVIKHRFEDKRGKRITNQEMYDIFNDYENVAVETEEGIYTNFEIIEDEFGLSVEDALRLVCEQTSKSMGNIADSLKSIAEKL